MARFSTHKIKSGQRKLGSGDDILRQLLSFGGMTFYKKYNQTTTVDADQSIGSQTGTFTCTRSATTPATWVDINGVIQVDTTSKPRFTQGFYDSTGFVSRPGLIVEGAGTNALTYASVLDNAAWTLANSVVGNPTVSADNATAPDGTASAYKVAYPAVSGTQYSSIKQIQTTSNVLYTSSIFVKAFSAGDVGKKLYIYQEGQINQTTITLTASWTRWTTSGTTAIVAGAKNAINIAQLGVGVGGADQAAVSAYIWGAQAEISPFATTFIPTTTAALTRNGETLTYPISGNRTAATESLFVKFTPHGTFANDGVGRYLIDSQTKSRDLSKFTTGTSLSWRPNTTDSGTSLATATTQMQSGTSYVAAGVAYGASAGTNAEIYINGTSEGTSTNDYTEPAWGTNFYVGCRNNALSQLSGIISSIAIFSDAKSANYVKLITDILNS